MREDLGNHGGMFGGGEDRQGAAAVGTLFNKEQTWLAEIGTSGYSQCQVEEDSGSDVPQIRRLNVQLDAKDEAHAAGIQAGLTFVPWKAALTFRYQ